MADSCIKCGKLRSSGVAFKSGKNQCMDCYNTYMREWNASNREEQLKKKKVYYAENKTKIRNRANKYWQSDWEPFLSDRFCGAEKSAEARINSKKRLAPLEFTITREFIYELIKKQDYKCAMSGIPLLHQWKKMRAASIDRIDSSKGYTPDNVQLVCKSINLMKNSHTVEEVKEFIALIRENYDA